MLNLWEIESWSFLYQIVVTEYFCSYSLKSIYLPRQIGNTFFLNYKKVVDLKNRIVNLLWKFKFPDDICGRNKH